MKANRKYIFLCEIQSTINQNMPIRLLLYIGRTYEKIIDNKAVYKERLLKIPTPQFVVLYNGSKEYPLETTLKLTDAFIVQTENPELELTVKVININHEKHNSILSKSKTLSDYSYFVYKIRNYKNSGLTLPESIEKAITDCIEEDKLKDFLEGHGTEVINMLYTEFNLEDYTEVIREETREDTIAMFLDILPVEMIAERTGLSIEKIEELKKQQKQ